MITITPEIAAVLRRSTITAGSVTLPERLERGLYERVDDVLRQAGGRWSSLAKAHLFEADPRERLQFEADDAAPGELPAAIVETVVALADVRNRFVHIPFAGRGALADQCVIAGAWRVVCIDPDDTAVADLKARGYLATAADFLTVMPPDIVKYDRIVMHPPPERDWRIFVTHALRCLAPRGRLVAVVPGSMRVDLGPGYEVTQFAVGPDQAYTDTTARSILVVKAR